MVGNININKYVIKLIEGKQPPYELIYILSSVIVETLTVYIETYLKTEFTQTSKSPADTSIMLDK